MEITIQKVLEYDDVFKGESINIEELLKKYNREEIVKVVCVLGHSYENAYLQSSTFFSEISKKHYQQLNLKVSSALQKLGVDDICYSTTKTSLELLRIAFSIPPNEYSNTGFDEDFEYDMFRVILMINQIIFSYKNDGKIELDELVYFNKFATNDINLTPLHSIFRTQAYYASEFFDFLEQYNPQIYSELLKFWGITDYRHYLLTIYSIFSICYDQQQKNPKGCWMLDFNKTHIQKGLFYPQIADKLAIDINEVIPYSNKNTNQRDDNIDYRTFRAKPLIRVSNNIYYVYNLQFIIERTYNSLFFDLKNVWSGDGFSNFFNKQFVEQSMFRHTMLLCLNKNECTFPTIQMVENRILDERPNQPDFYIRRGGSLVLFECKAFKINGELKDKADLQELLQNLKLKIYKSTDNIDKSRKQKKKPDPVGVTQLVNVIEKIDEDDFPFDDKIPDKVDYYPIIVLEDPRFIQPGLMSIVNRWSKDLLAEKLGNAAYYPVVITSIDILFQYSDTFRKIGFPRIIYKFIQLNAKLNKNGRDWEISPMADFNSYIMTNYKRNENDRTWFDGFMKEIAAILDIDEVSNHRTQIFPIPPANLKLQEHIRKPE